MKLLRIRRLPFTRKSKICFFVLLVAFLVVGIAIFWNIWDTKRNPKNLNEEKEKGVEKNIEIGLEKSNLSQKETWHGDERAIEIRAIQLDHSLQEGDLVDVRIRYPNGEEYILLSKRGCYDVSKEEERMTMWLREEELLRLSSSMVDAAFTEGLLYIVRYREEIDQKPSKITYIPRKEVQQLIKENPNIVGKAETILSSQLRNQLEERQRHWKEDFETTDWIKEQREESTTEREEIIYVD